MAAEPFPRRLGQGTKKGALGGTRWARASCFENVHVTTEARAHDSLA